MKDAEWECVRFVPNYICGKRHATAIGLTRWVIRTLIQRGAIIERGRVLDYGAVSGVEKVILLALDGKLITQAVCDAGGMKTATVVGYLRRMRQRQWIKNKRCILPIEPKWIGPDRNTAMAQRDALFSRKKPELTT
jgi:hypothetical protein